MSDLKIYEKVGKYTLSDYERGKLAAELPPMQLEIGEYMAKIERLKDQIKNQKAHADSISDTVMMKSKLYQDGWENRVQPCYCLVNHDRRVCQYFSCLTMDMIKEVPFEMGVAPIPDGGDLKEISPDDAELYTRTLYWDVKLYNFGPLKTVAEAAEVIENAVPRLSAPKGKKVKGADNGEIQDAEDVDAE